MLNQRANCQELVSNGLRIYTASDSANSLRRLSVYTKISREILSKIQRGEYDISSLGPTKLIKLLRSIRMSKELTKKVIEAYVDKEIIGIYAELWGESNFIGEQEHEVDLEDIIDDYFTFKVYVLLDNPFGVSREVLFKEFGLKYLNALNKLKNNDLVEETEGKFRLKNLKWKSFSTNFINKFIPEIVKEYKIGFKGTWTNYTMLYWGALNNKGVDQVIKSTVKYQRELDLIFKDKQYHGKKTYYVAMNSDGLLDRDVQRGEDEEIN